MLAGHEILKFDGFKGVFEALMDTVAVEEIVNLYVDGRLYAVFHCTPLKVEELAVGRLLTEGLIEDAGEVLEVKVSGKNVYVKLSGGRALDYMGKPTLTAALCEGFLPPQILKRLQRLRSVDLKFSAETIFKAVEVLNSRAVAFKASGGTHAAALIDEDGDIVSFAEDIGRHNAVDKVIGEAAIRGLDFSRLILASTGRLASEIVVKAALIGVPVIVSISAPTSMGIKVAETFGLTLVG
ncbi:MAG: formate dehydrogenase accessory sulfurtransferase FdhD, partial [Candidatus Bathyarchaeota archaeon]|nr:formate dehydrogenase accessory sulfurtransferase FdhD [Candidatus Bathyarchaeota archaeon]